MGSLLSHVRLIHADSPNFHVHCGLQKCSRTFKNFGTYRNHLYTFHKDVEKDVDIPSIASGEQTESYNPCNSPVLGSLEMEDGFGTQQQVSHSQSSPMNKHDHFLKNIQMAAGKWILKVREVNRLPISVVDGLLEDTQSLYRLALSHTRDRVADLLTKADVQDSVVSEIMKELSDNSPVSSLFTNLNTQAKQMNFFTKHFDLVVSFMFIYGCMRVSSDVLLGISVMRVSSALSIHVIGIVAYKWYKCLKYMYVYLRVYKVQ